MLAGFEKPTYVGIIFDMDDFRLNQSSVLRQIKDILLNAATKIGINARFFVSGNANLPKTHGESIGQIDSYVGYNDNNSFVKKFQDCVNGVGSQEDCNKFVFLITNRFDEKNIYNYKKGFMLNQMREYDCNIIVFEIKRDNDKLSSLVDEYEQKYIFCNDLVIFKKTIDDILVEIGHG